MYIVTIIIIIIINCKINIFCLIKLVFDINDMHNASLDGIDILIKSELKKNPEIKFYWFDLM